MADKNPYTMTSVAFIKPLRLYILFRVGVNVSSKMY